MEFQEAYNIINGADTNKFNVVYKNGSKSKARLFANANASYVCEFREGSRRYGTFFHLEDVVSIAPVTGLTPEVMFRRNCKKAIAILEKSGLWEGMLSVLKVWQEQDDDTIKQFYQYYQCHAGSAEFEKASQMYYNIVKDNKGLDFYCFGNLFKKGVIKAPVYDRYYKEDIIKEVSNAIKNKTEIYKSWIGSYDYSIHYSPEQNKAWYSEEYHHCGNGYYYLLLDEKNVFLCEKD